MRNSVLAAAIASAVVLASWSGQAAEKTVVMDVVNANCVLCPPIVRRSLMRVQGVRDVKMSQANQMADFKATVTFDDAVADVSMLIAAATGAGFPAHVADAK